MVGGTVVYNDHFYRRVVLGSDRRKAGPQRFRWFIEHRHHDSHRLPLDGSGSSIVHSEQAAPALAAVIHVP